MSSNSSCARPFSHLVLRCANRGQRGLEQTGQRDVVEPDHRHAPGTSMPSVRADRTTPAASRSLNAMIAVNSRSRAEARVPRRTPVRRCRHRGHRSQGQAGLLEHRADAGDAQDVASVGGPARNAIRRWPSSSRWRAAISPALTSSKPDVRQPRGLTVTLSGLEQRRDRCRPRPLQLQGLPPAGRGRRPPSAKSAPGSAAARPRPPTWSR